MTVDYSIFNSKHDRSPQAKSRPWQEFAAQFSRHQPCEAKADARLWSPASYSTGATRSAAAVHSVGCLVLDFDDGTPLSEVRERLESYEWAAHSTFSHSPDHPKFRVVIPLAEPIPGSDWPDFWARAVRLLTGGHHDPACCDTSRMYYVPSCPPGQEPWFESHEGRPLSYSDLPPEEAPVPTPSPVQPAIPSQSEPTDCRPGADFNQRADFLQILLSDGWTEHSRSGDEMRLTRPDKDTRDGSSASLHKDKGSLHVFTSSSNLKPGENYTPFGYLTATQFEGSFTECAKWLRSEGYGGDDPQYAESIKNTELGNARRLVARHGNDLRHCAGLGWLVWTGTRWIRDETGEVERRAKETVASIYEEAALADDKERPKIAQWAMISESLRQIRAMIELAKTEPGIAVAIEQLDTDSWLLNVSNGTLDLRTGELREHRREDMFTKIAPVTYSHSAACPTWEGFLSGVFAGDQELITSVQQAIGYSMTGETGEHVVPFLHGRGSNGKSTFLTTLQAMLGDYAGTAAPGLLLESRGDRHPTDLADLRGKRFVASTEVDDGAHLAEALFKQLSGGDGIKARLMRQDFFEFRPSHKIWLAVNHKPIVRGDDLGIWRRIALIPFEVTFTDDPDDGHPMKDRTLPKRLLQELPGILRWAVEGCLAWQAEGGLRWPQVVRAASLAYRSDSDLFGQFLEECCQTGPTCSALGSELYVSYTCWTKEQGVSPMSKPQFGRKLSERGFTSKTSNSQRRWLGVALAE